MQVSRPDEYVVGVDIGGTNCRAAVVGKEGLVNEGYKQSTLAEQGPDVVTRQIADTVRKAIDAAGLPKESIKAVGCGMPGRVDPSGVILWSPNFPGIEDYPLVEKVSDALQMPVFMDNDANVAALGEHGFGAGRGVRSLVMFTLGTGIGGGIVLNNQVWSGANGGGAEIGHQVVCPGGRKCGCGNHGCLESMAQQSAIVERAVKKIQEGRESLLADATDSQIDRITPKLISDFAKQGDQICQETLAETGYWVGLGVANVINLLNPEMVIIGGGIAAAGEHLWDTMVRTVRALAIQESRNICQIVLSQLGDNAGILGGATLASRATKD